MADTLRLVIDIDGSKGEKALKGIISQMESAGKVTDKLQKNIADNPRYMQEMAKTMQNSLKATERAMTSLANQAQNIRTGNVKVGSSLSQIGSIGSTVGTSLQRSFSGLAGTMKTVFQNTLLVAGALGGLSAGKLATDYLAFSKAVGQANSIVRGDASSAKVLETMAIQSSIGTGQTAADILEMSRAFMSTGAFDPSKGGQYKPGSEEFNKNITSQAGLLKEVGEFATANAVNPKTVMTGIVQFGNIYGKDITSAKDRGEILDSLTALLKTSQGELEELIPEAAKFAQNFKHLGVSSDKALAIFATLTNVFGVSEAGTRTLALSNWSSDNTKIIRKLAADKDLSKYAGRYEQALFKKEGGKSTAYSIEDQIKNVMSLISSVAKETDDKTARLLTGAIFPEIRQTSGVKTLGAMFDDLSQNMQVFVNKQGISLDAVKAYWTTTGAKIDNFFKSIQSAGFTTFGTLISLIGGGNVDIKTFQETMKMIAEDASAKLGPNFGKLFLGISDFVTFLNSEGTRSFLGKAAEVADKWMKFASQIGGKMIDIALSEPVQKFLDWVLEHPEMSLAIALTGIPLLQAAVATAISAGFANGIIPLSGLVAAAVYEGWKQYENWKKESENANNLLKSTQSGTNETLQKMLDSVNATAPGSLDRKKALNLYQRAYWNDQIAQAQLIESEYNTKAPITGYVNDIAKSLIGMPVIGPNYAPGIEQARGEIDRLTKEYSTYNKPQNWQGILQSFNLPLAGGNKTEGVSEASSHLKDTSDSIKVTAENMANVTSALKSATDSMNNAASKLGLIQINVNGGGSSSGTTLTSNSSEKSLWNGLASRYGFR